MSEMVMQTKEPDTTRESTDRLVKTLNSTYAKEKLKQVANKATKMNDDERNQLIRLLEYFGDLFYVTLLDRYIDPADL